MPWRGPSVEGEYPTLGFAVIDALENVLPSPSDVDAPLTFTEEQARLILSWYRVHPTTGAFMWRRSILEMVKGWGKSPVAGALAIAEMRLEVLFDGWNADGEPVGRPWGTGDSPPPWVQIAAVSEDQTDNTYLTLYEMLTANDGRAAELLGIDANRTILYLEGDRPGRLEPVTASAGSREGQRLTFAVMDETHLWTRANRGIPLANTLRRNVAKMSGRTFETTNAPILGEGSVAESSGKAVDAGEKGIMFYAVRPDVEPDPGWTDAKLRKTLRKVYGDARWVDPKRIVAEIRDPATDWNDALRFYFNVRTPGSSRAVDPRKWEALARAEEVAPGTEVGLGFEGSMSVGYAALRACTREGYSFVIETWEPPAGAKAWTVPRAAVDDAVRRAFETYKVGLMLCDEARWQSEIEAWAEAWGTETVLGFPTFPAPTRFARATDRWLTALREKTHTHDGDPTTAEHVRAAHLVKTRVNDPEDDSRTMYVLKRGEEGRQITAAVADVLALEAAATMPQESVHEVAIAWT